MEQSILISTKKVCGLPEDYIEFDHDITTFINSTFTQLIQLGVGPSGGFSIDDTGAETWDDFVVDPPEQIHMVKTYVHLKARLLFDPPPTSFHIEAMEQQIREHEFRLNIFNEPPD
jgi:hypothetical protein